MKTIAVLLNLLCFNALLLTGQSFNFTMPTTQFVLIPGGGFESRVHVDVPSGDSVILTATSPPGLKALFQPSVVYQSQDAFLVVISVDSSLAPQQTLTVCAHHLNDSIKKTVIVDDANNGHGFYLIDSARTLLDTAFGFLKHSFPTQKIFLNELEQLQWTGCFPYPPLLIVTHHLFVSGNWRATVLWHNMIPPDNWEKIFIYNEAIDSCYGVNIDSWGTFTHIPCEIQHYTIQDIDFDVSEADMEPEILCRPNPTVGVINITFGRGFSGPATLRIMDISGQLIREMEVWEDELCVDIGNEKPGLYILTAKGKKGFKALKIVKL